MGKTPGEMTIGHEESSWWMKMMRTIPRRLKGLHEREMCCLEAMERCCDGREHGEGEWRPREKIVSSCRKRESAVRCSGSASVFDILDHKGRSSRSMALECHTRLWHLTLVRTRER